MPITFVLADDHPLVLSGLENLFRPQKDFKILARCRDGEQTLRAVRAYKPDILILDLNLPEKPALAVLSEMRKELFTPKVVILTAAAEDRQLSEALRLGLRGLVLKEADPQSLIECIRRVHAGELWLDQRTASSALEKLLRREAGRQAAESVLTTREVEIVKHVALGQCNMEVAKRLFISQGTVKVHLYKIYKKLDLDNRSKLTRYAQQRHLI